MKNGMTQWIHMWKKSGWVTATRQPVKNRELWERLDDLQNRVNSIEFVLTLRTVESINHRYLFAVILGTMVTRWRTNLLLKVHIPYEISHSYQNSWVLGKSMKAH